MSKILGVFPYADGVVAVQGNAIFFSTDGNVWAQVNRDTYVAQTGTVEVTNTSGTYIDVVGTSTSFTTEYTVGDHIRIDGNIRQIASITSNTAMTLETEISGGVTAGTAHYKNGQDDLSASSATVRARTSQGRAQFAWYPSDGEYGSITISDEAGENDLAYFKITGTGASRVYYYDVLTEADFSAPPKPKYICQFQERIVTANDENGTGYIAWSERLSNQRFDGASAGVAQIDAPIVAVKSLRDRVIIFTSNSIHQLVELDDPNQLNTAILPVTYNVGCASGWSVQEMGGDLIFLAHDGVRTLKASDTYGDVQFGTISRQIDPYIKSLLQEVDILNISSTVFRFKNQYRLYYTRESYADDQQIALSATLKMNNAGQLGWQWARVVGIPVACIETTANSFISGDAPEKHYHGGFDGYVYEHDVGSSFNGEPIHSVLELNELDYGDIGRRKTLHYVKIFGDLEAGSVDEINMQVKYDFESAQTMQPDSYTLTNLGSTSVYGSAVYDTDTYGGLADWLERVLIEGSGYSNKFIFNSLGTGESYNLNSLYIDMRIGPLQ